LKCVSESIILNHSSDHVFEFVKDFRNIKKIVPSFCKSIEYQNEEIEEGNSFSIIWNDNELTKYVIDNIENNNTCDTISFSTTLSRLKERKSFEVLSISDNMSLLSLNCYFDKNQTKESEKFLKTSSTTFLKLIKKAIVKYS